MRTWIDVTVTLMLVGAAVLVVLSFFQPITDDAVDLGLIPAAPVPMAGAVQRGNRGAPVGLAVFSDFQCPQCASFGTETLPSLLAKYVDRGRVLLAFRHLPLERTHPEASRAAEIAGCAEKLGRFWRVHDAFFTKPTITGASEFELRAIGAGLTRQALDECRRGGLVASQIEEDIALAATLRLRGTPVTLIGKLSEGQIDVTRVIYGARPPSDFEVAIDRLLGEAATK